MSAAARFDVVEPELPTGTFVESAKVDIPQSEPPKPELVKAETQVPSQSSAAKSQAADESIRVSTSKLEKLLNYVGEMVILGHVPGLVEI